MLQEHKKRLAKHQKAYEAKKEAVNRAVEHTGTLEVQARDVEAIFKQEETTHGKMEKYIFVYDSCIANMQ